MKTICIFIFVMILTNVKSQIGINTSNPLATLEVHRSSLSTVPDGIIPPRMTADSLQLKDHLYGPAQEGALIYITKPVSRISNKTQQMGSSGYYIYDSSYTNKDQSRGKWKKMVSDPNAFAANSISNVTFSSMKLSTSKSNFQAITFDSAIDNEIGSEYIVDNQYVVPETGLYVINYYVKFDNVNSKTVSQKPGIAIVKSAFNNSARSLLTSKIFDAVLSAYDKNSSVSISPQASVNHIYNLKEGDKLNFGLITENDEPASLDQVSTEISIYKIR